MYYWKNWKPQIEFINTFLQKPFSLTSLIEIEIDISEVVKAIEGKKDHILRKALIEDVVESIHGSGICLYLVGSNFKTGSSSKRGLRLRDNQFIEFNPNNDARPEPTFRGTDWELFNSAQDQPLGIFTGGVLSEGPILAKMGGWCQDLEVMRKELSQLPLTERQKWEVSGVMSGKRPHYEHAMVKNEELLLKEERIDLKEAYRGVGVPQYLIEKYGLYFVPTSQRSKILKRTTLSTPFFFKNNQELPALPLKPRKRISKIEIHHPQEGWKMGEVPDYCLFVEPDEWFDKNLGICQKQNVVKLPQSDWGMLNGEGFNHCINRRRKELNEKWLGLIEVVSTNLNQLDYVSPELKADIEEWRDLNPYKAKSPHLDLTKG